MNLFLQVTQMGLFDWAVHIFVIAALTLLSAQYLKGIYVKDFSAAIVLALVIAVLNVTLGWAMRGLATPLNWVTFGLFSGLIAWGINMAIVWVADRFVKGFEAKNLFWTVIFALILGIGNFLLNIIT